MSPIDRIISRCHPRLLATSLLSLVLFALLTPTAHAAGDASAAYEQWSQKLGASGEFQAPEPTWAEHPEYGLAAANAVELEPLHVADFSITLSATLWVATAIAAVLTLLIAGYLGKIQRSDGSQGWGFTLGTKLSLAMGTMTTLILIISSLAITSLYQIEKNEARLTRANSILENLNKIEIELLNTRIVSQRFLRDNDNTSLEDYTAELGGVQGRLNKIADEVVTDEQTAQIEQIRTALAQYDSAFAQVVRKADERDSTYRQLAATGWRVLDLLAAIKETAEVEDNQRTAMVAAETLNEIAVARISVMKFVDTHDLAWIDRANEHFATAASGLRNLIQTESNATRRSWLVEANDGIGFYVQNLVTYGQHVSQGDDIILGQLDVLGPQILEAGRQMAAESAQTAHHIHDDEEALFASITGWTIAGSVVAIVLAVAIAFLLITSITSVVTRLLATVRAIAAGDLSQPLLEPKGRDELASLGRAADTMTQSLRQLIGEVKESAEAVNVGASQIATASEEISKGLLEQNDQVVQVSASIEQMSASIVEVARKSGDASGAADEAGRMAEQGGEVVHETIGGMNTINETVSDSSKSVTELGKRGAQIGEVITVINDIADQTNLLALNAAIEAARAGEHGRGFAVVADEVRKLADRTTKATEEIGDSIEAIQTETESAVVKMGRGTEQVEVGVTKATSAGESLEKIVTASREVAGMIQSIAAAAEQQSSASEEVSRSVSSIRGIAEESSRGADQAAQAATSLTQKSERLNDLVSKFRLAA
ncbi:methyl-accepting chemotaxis protein [Mucisphaera calidilacus]|uniref:Methyl-accepting chemotaxis protein McpB n=1 Tax=Mucisphaera calidilacus TaxID=2527982 RepID=A0A518BZJ4_9BACT|nr:methyl-accepting chemotaxis protein [Mucisphaera calidilacus]QDU72381.1 Methyl-accepting chemotaxis protein McpB [Mucisphaera calidilacus]